MEWGPHPVRPASADAPAADGPRFSGAFLASGSVPKPFEVLEVQSQAEEQIGGQQFEVVGAGGVAKVELQADPGVVIVPELQFAKGKVVGLQECGLISVSKRIVLRIRRLEKKAASRW